MFRGLLSNYLFWDAIVVSVSVNDVDVDTVMSLDVGSFVIDSS